jgi:ABC-type antimicrobial peptide transport system permease subunit
VIHLAIRDLRHAPLAFAFGVLGLGILVFAFLLLIPLSLALGRLGEAEDLHQNLILVERGALQPEESRIPPSLASRVAATLGERLDRIDPVIFRILRVEDLPIQLRGVAPETWTTTFGLRLLEGTWPVDDSQVLIGQLAATDGGWGVGDKITIYGRGFLIAGITEGSGTQTQTVWMSYGAASQLFGSEKQPQFLVAHLAPGVDPLSAKDDVEAGLRSTGTLYDAYFEDALLREYGAALRDLRSLALALVLLAVVAVTLGSHNLAWLAAEERLHLLGVLRTVGFDHGAVTRYLLIRAGIITLGAYLLALGAAGLFIRMGAGVSRLSIAGTPADLSLTLPMALLGLSLTIAAGLLGTWLSVRKLVGRPPALLLGRGPGSGFA